ncbi:polyprenol monophosphomannose synthase [Blastococcus tunisiensis]|uniref:Dolichol-phosphate mannosyltransferase n=1 Tax=Blastococcus tunisiensis TaxID=1798228 RepID=A0A1I2J1E0_9ACTN|nr:polyprenol monophosphomannose synthase [Blastococcus sp. DSM 46838]SFF46561.1 dolichol-phosphate mannosyltransferase [Blastococcus sp. DSM 46838]
MTPRVLVVVPTYDEVDNLESILDRLHASVPEAHALVADDGSPDGTGQLADKLAARDDRVHVLHRGAKLGLGRAYVAGFRWAREHGFDVLVEMDADGSHAPEQLPDLLAALRTADLALGSRYVPGGAVRNWPAHRQLLSRAGNRYTRWALRLPLSDATGGYRAARAELIDRLPFDDVASQGYCFQVDWAWRAVRAGARVVEVPIVFTERTWGRSKMSGSIVREALVRVTVWGLQDRLAERLPGLVRPPVPARAGRREAGQHE